MAISHDITSVVAFQNVVKDFSGDLLRKSFYSGTTATLATAHLDVIGELVMTRAVIGSFGRRYAKAFNPPGNSIVYSPRVLKVEMAKFELQLSPQDFRNSYLGAMQQRAFNGLEQIPFEGFIMEDVAKRQGQEIAESQWQAVKATSPAATDSLNQIHDGWLRLIAIDLAATTPALAPTPVPTGNWTAANIIPTLEAMWATLDPGVRNGPLAVFLPSNVWLLFQQAYRALYPGTPVNSESGRAKLDFGLGVDVIYTPEMGTTRRVVMTDPSNLHYGFDNSLTPGGFNFEQNKRDFDYWFDFQMGVQFGFLDAGTVAVSDIS